MHITSPGGTDLRFRAGDRPANLQDGDASAARSAQGKVLVDKEIELPAGVVRVAPLEDTVEGVIAFPPSQWDGRPVEGLKLRFSKGRVVEVTAASGRDAVEAGDVEGRRGRPRVPRVRPRASTRCSPSPSARRGFRTTATAPASSGCRSATTPSLAARSAAGYVRWNFFTDLTVTVGGTTWVRNGTRSW